MHKTIKVLAFPPKDPLNIFVRLEFLYGMCAAVFPSALSEITCIKKNKLLFILFPYFNLEI